MSFVQTSPDLITKIWSLNFKAAILDFFSACVERQPGFIQLLIGVKPEVKLVLGQEVTSSEKEASANKNVEIVDDKSCLKQVIQLLKVRKLALH